MSPTQPHHIVAIGASAGGMEEINAFFDYTPCDGVAYVIVQHLSPDFKSRMAEVVGRHSKLEVKEAENGMEVQSNKVYTIPSNKYMTIRESRLFLSDREKSPGPHLTINKFFNSLATDMGTKAIGVVLSGLGSDGSEGVKAIKKEGGLIIVRNPQTSEFGSMPSNAIATGVVDFVLEPELMPETIEDYVTHGPELLLDSEDNEKNLNNVIEIIKQQSPFDFSDYKPSTILRRIRRRAAYNKIPKLENYVEFLRSTPDEVEALSKDFLIGVTSFFRDKKAFEFIKTKILPDILKKFAPGEELKMWVAGCATGEEAYSLAMLICEQLTGNFKDTNVKIFATDIDAIALQQAGKGIYNAGITKDVTEERLEKHFIKEGNNYRIKPEIRKMVIFAQHDLVKNPPYCNMHFISCRNLLIYMTPPLQKKIFLMLLFGLKLEGYLFLGSSENPLPIIQNLEVVNSKLKIYKNLETKRLVRFDAFSLPELTHKPTPFIRDDSSQNTNNTLAEAVNENLMSELDCLTVCIDEINHVIKTYGDTTKYLLQKNFNQNLTELLPRPLAVAFNTVSTSVLKTNKKGIVSGIKIKSGEHVIKVTLAVTPLNVKKGGQRLLMVTFKEESPANAGNQQQAMLFDEKIYLDKYNVNLEEEVNDLKDKLHSAYLQLDASNENMQSFNEELLSANEEMQSANEEMQSINEELHTINADYQLKNKELLELNDDLNNYFRSNVNGQLFVNNDLQLMKFSPGTIKQINLLPTDVGRPLSNISTNIKFENIIGDIKQVIADGNVITKEIETENGKWYQVMTMPYIQQASNVKTGAIITFNDITALKKVQHDLDKKNESLMRINADLDNFVHTASHDLLAPLANMEMSIQVMNTVGIADSRLKRFFETINSSAKKFRALIKEIAGIAKVESEMLIMKMIDLNELLNDIEWSLEDKIKASGATITRHLEVAQVYFSKKNLRSILFNLISNSIKFRSEAPPVIIIHSNKENRQLIITVQDNGIGISKDDRKKIFNMYGRVYFDVEGNGIGLYLAKKIIDAAGGKIELESEPGKGSKFTIYFNEEKDNIAGGIHLN